MYWSGATMRMENAVDVKNADGLEIVGNEMHGFTANKTLVFQKGPANIGVECNEMYDGFTGVELRGEMGGVVENVRFVRNLMHDFPDYGLKLDGVVGADVLHNTFVDVASDGLRIENLGLDGGAVRNNLWLRTGNVDGGAFDADHNGFFDTGNVGIASPSDVNADPQLDADFHLGATSPMIDAGVDVMLRFSGAAPDIGWDETGLDACAITSGSGGAGGGPGSGGVGSGTGGGAASNGAGGSSATPVQEEESGCGCRVASRSAPPAWLLVALSALALRLASRPDRRRHTLR
jgi:hypothetical protein